MTIKSINSNVTVLFMHMTIRIFMLCSVLLPGLLQAQNSLSVSRPEKDNSVEAELASFTVDKRLQVNLFADESMGIANPVCMRWDGRGRLWVLCTWAYPQLKPGTKSKLLQLPWHWNQSIPIAYAPGISFFKNKIRRNPIPEDIDKEELSSNLDTLVFGKDEEKLPYKLSPCCNAIPGDEVFGFISINDGIKVHKKNCPNAISLQSNYAYRIIASNWIDASQEEFVAEIALNGLDNLGLVSNITKVISNQMNVNMRSINFNTDGGTFSGKIKVVVKNNDTLKKLIGNLKHINGIEKVSRL